MIRFRLDSGYPFGLRRAPNKFEEGTQREYETSTGPVGHLPSLTDLPRIGVRSRNPVWTSPMDRAATQGRMDALGDVPLTQQERDALPNERIELPASTSFGTTE